MKLGMKKKISEKSDFPKNVFWAQIWSRIGQNDVFGHFTKSSCMIFVKLQIRMKVNDFQRMPVVRVAKKRV